MSTQSFDMHMRYVAAKKSYEWKQESSGQTVVIAEGNVAALLQQVGTGPQGAGMVKVLKFLFDAAKKDPTGNWVSASNAPVKNGQATI